MVMSMFGWQTATLPLGRKAALKQQKPLQSAISSVPSSQPNNLSRKSVDYAGHNAPYAMNTILSVNEKPVAFGGVTQGYKIIPDLSTNDSYVYERSEDASDISTYYSNDSAETFRALLNAKPGQRTSVLRPIENSLPRPTHKVTDAPRSQPMPLPGSRDIAFSDMWPSQNDDFYCIPSGGVAVSRRPSVNEHPSDGNTRLQGESARSRRLSGPVIPTGFGILPCERVSPPSKNSRNERPSPPAIRTSPSSEVKRDRFSPEREVSPVVDGPSERRMSNIGFPTLSSSPERERAPIRRSSQSSGSSLSSGRHSPQEDKSRISGFAPRIRNRILSRSRKLGGPKPIVVDGLEMSCTQGSGRTVRFSEQLICPSPVPVEKRRKGWFNRRGDQLWTNDGLYVEPERGSEFPLDLSEYPEPGVGWQNEEGIRIDTQHRLIPKVPKRPALKRGSGGSTSPPGSQHQQGGNGRSEGRGYYTGGPIYEEP